MKRFLADALAAFGSKGGIETADDGGGPFRRTVVPWIAAACLGMFGVTNVAPRDQARDSIEEALFATGVPDSFARIVHSTITLDGSVQAALNLLAGRLTRTQSPDAAVATSGQGAFAPDVFPAVETVVPAPVDEAQAVDEVAGVENAAGRFGLTEAQTRDIARFAVLMDESRRMLPFDPSGVADEGSDPFAAELAVAYRQHLGEAHAVAFATLVMAREGAGPDAATLAGRLRAVRVALFGAGAAGRGEPLSGLAAAALEASSAMDAALAAVETMRPRELAARPIRWISDAAKDIAERVAHPPEELAWMSWALAETRVGDDGCLVPHPALPEAYRLSLTEAQDEMGFRCDPMDGVPSFAAAPPAWTRLPHDDMADGPPEVLQLDDGEAGAVEEALDPGESLVSCGPVEADGSRDVFLISMSWQLQPAVLDAHWNLDRHYTADAAVASKAPSA